ncbi:cytolytic toxin-alpha-like [Oppia nitens]|uniref:cytolytic toxin-alpha-like n=1 Tax=Oppia nitens TaxID=1686743 RepID=UPI0023DBB4FA|nr:cytolytic toxin-alpha-like [Oppia nitens]
MDKFLCNNYVTLYATSDDYYFGLPLVGNRIARIEYGEIIKSNNLKLAIEHRASLGRVAQLGEYYDARTDQFLGLNMFNRTLDQPDQISRIDNAYTSLTMIQSDSLSDKFDQLDISVSLRLSFLAGIISIGGSARYLNDKRTSARSARISLQHSILTQYESLQTMDSRLLDYVDVRALDQLDVTHVVTGIQWGGKCIVSVSDSNEMSDEHRNIQAKLSMELNLVVAKITAEVGVNYTDNTFKNLSMYNFEVYGDILPDRVPENIVDALLFMNMTPTLLRNGNQGKGKQVSFTLTPVNVLRELWEREIKVSAFVHEIEESIVNKCVQLFDDMNAIQQQLNDYFTDFTNHWEPYVRDEAVTELQQLVANYTIYQTTNTKLLSALLIKIRAGNESVDQLIDILLKSRNDTYSREEMDNKLAKYDRLKNQLLLVDFVGNISTQANWQ